MLTADAGNHELYVADVAYLTFYNFSRTWGGKYLTSNVQIMDNETKQWTRIGQTHRYFTTPNGEYGGGLDATPFNIELTEVTHQGSV